MDLKLLRGTWRGRGSADFPTIDRVEYDDELRFEWQEVDELFSYEQRTSWNGGASTHNETGFVRFDEDGSVQMWNAQNNGRTEVLSGTYAWDSEHKALVIDVQSRTFGNDPRMVESRRTIRVGASTLTYEMSMQTTTTDVPETLPHLSSELGRTP